MQQNHLGQANNYPANIELSEIEMLWRIKTKNDTDFSYFHHILEKFILDSIIKADDQDAAIIGLIVVEDDDLVKEIISKIKALKDH